MILYIVTPTMFVLFLIADDRLLLLQKRDASRTCLELPFCSESILLIYHLLIVRYYVLRQSKTNIRSLMPDGFVCSKSNGVYSPSSLHCGFDPSRACLHRLYFWNCLSAQNQHLKRPDLLTMGFLVLERPKEDTARRNVQWV